MNQILVLSVLPPSTNHSHIHTRNGFTFISPKTKEFRQEVQYQARVQAIEMYHGWLRNRVDISFGKFKNGKFKAGDASNRIKQLEDSLNSIAWTDDEQVVETHIYRHFDELPYCKISISTIDDGPTRGLPDQSFTVKTARGERIKANKQVRVGNEISESITLGSGFMATHSDNIPCVPLDRTTIEQLATTGCYFEYQADGI
jgi:Holliday junction resolvase RusA-like endonuclease